MGLYGLLLCGVLQFYGSTRWASFAAAAVLLLIIYHAYDVDQYLLLLNACYNIAKLWNWIYRHFRFISDVILWLTMYLSICK